MKINDIASRAFKTFVQSFLGILIPEIVVFLNDIQVKELSYDSLLYVAIPVVCSALAAGISAAWNCINNILIDKKEDN